MNWLFDNFQILLVIGLALAAWLKNRAESKEEEEAERRAREEMVRHLQEMEKRPIEKTPPPVPQKWSTNPNQPAPTPSTATKPPPLREIFNQSQGSENRPPSSAQQAAPRKDAYANQPSPWEQFQHRDASHSEISDDEGDSGENPAMKRQREMQEKLAELKREAAQYKGTVAGARETQRRLERKGTQEIAAMPSIASVLSNKPQVKRAIILNEILNKPIALR